MPTNGTTTSYLINTQSAINVLDNTEPLLIDIVNVTWDSGLSKFVFEGSPNRNGFVIKTPIVQATKAEIATFLQNLSGQTVVANNILNIKVYSKDNSFLEVIIV